MVKRPNRNELVELRNGKHSLEEALDNISELDVKLKEAFDNSELPDTVDEELVDEFLIGLNCGYLGIKYY